MFYELHLPFPPTVNSYYKRNHGYGVRISDKGRKFRAEVQAEIEEQWGSFEMLEGKLLVEVIEHVPDKRIRDLDNYMKPLLDALTHAGIWEDDSQINQLMIYRGAQCYSGKIALRIHDAGPVLPIDAWPD